MKQFDIFKTEKKIVDNTIPSDVILSIKNLTKIYSKNSAPALDKVSMEIKKGEFHAFVGSNGAGKTTTIKAIIGATKKFDGEIFVNGVKNNYSKILSKVAYIPEVTVFPSQMTTLDFLMWNASIYGLNKKDAIEKIEFLTSKYDISNFLKRKPANFSSGQQKKIMLIQALLKDPDILIMDEPAANLDPQTRFAFFSYLKDLQKEGKTIFISSHVLNEVGEYADSVTILEKGKLVATGKIDEFSKEQGFQYSLQPFDDAAFTKLLNKLKIEFKYDETDKIFEINLKEEKEFLKLMEKSNENKIFFKNINKKELNLKEIYSKFVLKQGEKQH